MTPDELRKMLAIVPYDTAMDADGMLYVHGEYVCNVVELLEENALMFKALNFVHARSLSAQPSAHASIARYVEAVIDRLERRG